MQRTGEPQPAHSVPSAPRTVQQVPPLPDAWSGIADLNLADEFRIRVQTLRTVPFATREAYSRIQVQCLAELHRATTDESRTAAWKLLLVLPRMMLHPVGRGGEAGASCLRRRVAMFDQGRWRELVETSRGRQGRRQARRQHSSEHRRQTQVRAAMRLIEQGN